MKTVVVTGGIATGKSTFCRRWRESAPETAFFDADQAAHELLTSAGVMRTVISEFGACVARPDGTIDRAKLREVAFGDGRDRRRLERLLHPLVLDRCRDAQRDAAASGATVLLADIPLYFEAEEFDFPVDLVIVVATDPDTQSERLCARPGIGPTMAERMISSQMPLPEKAERADVVVWNAGGAASLHRQVPLAQKVALARPARP